MPATVGWRIAIVCAPVLLIVLALAAITGWQTQVERQALEDTRTRQDSLTSVRDSATLWLYANTLVGRYILTPAPEARQQILVMKVSVLENLDAAIEAERGTGANNDTALLTPIRDFAVNGFATMEASLDATDAGDLTAAGQILFQGLDDSQSISTQFEQYTANEEADIEASSQLSKTAADNILTTIVVSIASAIALAALATVAISRTIVKPLTELKRTAGAIAAGDLTARPSSAGPREVSQVADALTTMAAAIEGRERELRESKERATAIVANSRDVILVVGPDFRIRFMSPAVERIIGFTPEDCVGRLTADFIHPDDLREQAGIMASVAAGTHDGAPLALRIRHVNSGWVPVEATISHLIWNGEPSILVSSRDITERIKAAEQISYMAYHDTLTNLPNRALFNDRAAIAMAQASRSGGIVCLLSVDLDRFKMVNDTLGHAAGDDLLKEAADRLSALVRAGDTVARIGGDEFVLLLPACESIDDAISVGNRVTLAFRRPFLVQGKTFHTTASVGLAVYGEDGEDVESLMRSADAAMYTAKDGGRDAFQRYIPGMAIDAAEWLATENDLRGALSRNEIKVFYQPQVSLSTGEIVGVEALARWNHPTKGLVLPLTFIPVAEDTGLIVEIGDFVLRRACSDAVSWGQAGALPVRLAVNVSYGQIVEPGFAQRVATILLETGLEAGQLQLEITESAALKDVKLTRTVTEAISALGVRLSIDDFGAGSTSLRYLKEFPISELKIDQGFMCDFAENPNNAAIATSVISLGHQLNLNVIAEGIETQDQLNFFREHLCDDFQGFLHSMPMPADELLGVLMERTVGAALSKGLR